MTMLIKNIEYFEWKVPEELLTEENLINPQTLIDKYFELTDESVEETSDPYYEYEGHED